MTGDTPQPAEMRREYEDAGLTEADLAPTWHEQFARWFAAAVAADQPEPNAMVVATADARGRPSARTVLMKGMSPRGLVFYTNYESRKGNEIRGNPYASLLFVWLPLHRQVRLDGAVEVVDRIETEAYFASRPRGAQIGAWASPQSRVIPDRDALENRVAAAADRFPGDIPAPPHWGGLRVVPDRVEFWQGRGSRLHDRLRYRRTDEGEWIIERLAP